MKKNIVILIIAILLVSFVGLVYYAIVHSRGIPTSVEKIEKVVLEVPFIDKDIDLNKGISQELWDSIVGKEVKLMYQVMVLPWPKVAVPQVTVKVFHNKDDIYFYLSWRDDTQDMAHLINKFSDACAVMFPMEDKSQPASIMMGFIGRANIWQWKASQDREYWLGIHPQTDVYPVRNVTQEDKPDISNGAYSDYYYPFEEQETLVVSKVVPKSAINDLMAIRVGTVTPKDIQSIHGRGFWKDGVWSVVLKRKINAIDPEVDAVFDTGKKRLCAFAVWNGSKGDRGGRKSISDWVELQVK